jgi:hypothetical protein
MYLVLPYYFFKILINIILPAMARFPSDLFFQLNNYHICHNSPYRPDRLSGPPNLL